jgi:hypothetical protein
MIIKSSQLWKKNCAAFLKQMLNFNLLITVTSDINDVFIEFSGQFSFNSIIAGTFYLHKVHLCSTVTNIDGL